MEEPPERNRNPLEAPFIAISRRLRLCGKFTGRLILSEIGTRIDLFEIDGCALDSPEGSDLSESSLPRITSPLLRHLLLKSHEERTRLSNQCSLSALRVAVLQEMRIASLTFLT